jgi:hypothetical protein
MKLRDIGGALLLTITLTSCVPEKDKKVALDGIGLFHNQFNKSEFSEIYEGANQALKEKISKDRLVEDMNALRRGQGAVLKSQEMALDYNYMDGNVMVKIIVQVTFERGTGKEEFIFSVTDGRAQLVSYHFLSP